MCTFAVTQRQPFETLRAIDRADTVVGYWQRKFNNLSRDPVLRALTRLP